jgi:DNA-binding Lrp family transcriptional regulator
MVMNGSVSGLVSKLTVNEKIVLKMLLQNSRVPDIEIAKKIRVSSQAVSKIRRKLRNMKVIERDMIHLDYGALGINTFALVLFDIVSSGANKFVRDEDALKNSLGFYKVIKNDISHIGLFGFNSLEEADDYFDFLHSKYFDVVKVKHVYTFPMKSFFKHSTRDLFTQIIKEFGKEQRPVPMALSYHEVEDDGSKLKKLNANEKKVLKLLLQNDKVTCREIVSQLEEKDLTTSAVNKIKKRLEEKGAIKSYSVKLNHERLGVNVLSFIFVANKKACWDLKDGLFKGACDDPNVIGCYKLNQESLSVLFCGFRDVTGLDHYCHALESKNKDLLSIEKVYIVPPKGIIKNSTMEIL